MSRYFIYLGYDGENYCGWQAQPNGTAVQQVMEDALATLFRQTVTLVGAGRTDAGVHARSMVAHFDTDVPVGNLPRLTDKLNRLLPKDIAIDRIAPVRKEAHARFDALSRTYKYYVSARKDPFNGRYVYTLRHALDFDAMNEACLCLHHNTDYACFSKRHTDVKTHNCRITHAGWCCEGEVWIFTITADRFLRNMVRAIVGTLFDVGRSKLTIEGFKAVIESQDRCRAGTSAPPHALFLTDITYPEEIFLLSG